jgi:hypothetical protein
LSYDWITLVLTNYINEILLLLKSNNNSSDNLYTRDDICEIEPTIVICLLRLVIRYIIELEELDKSDFTKSQLKCFEETKKSISIYLLPSLDKILSSFFNDLSILQNQTSQSIISSLQQRLHQSDI